MNYIINICKIKKKVVSLQPKINYIGLRNRKNKHSKPI